MRDFKCLYLLDYDEMVGSRICIFKDVDLSNMLFSDVYFAPLDGRIKSIKNT